MSEYGKGQANFRDMVIAYIIGMQNEMQDRKGEGYTTLQKLLEQIEERHGGMYEKFRG